MANTTWNFDKTHSTVSFKVRHMMFSKVNGKFSDWDGQFEFDTENPTAAKISGQVDVASIDTGVEDRDNHLRSADFFDVENHPKISFNSTKLDAASGTNFKLHGDLTIRGVTKPIVLDVEYHGEGIDPWGNTRVGFSAKGEIHRKEYGLTWNQTLETGGVLVGDKVEVELEMQAVKAS